MKIDLSDITFLIPVRLDSIVRLENLQMTVQFLQKNFICKIIVLEADKYNNGVLKHLLRKVDYIFIEDRDPVFYRTKYLNNMTQRVTTKFLAIWDADVVVPKEQIMESVEKLRAGYDVALPYGGIALDTSLIIREQYLLSKSINLLKGQKAKMKLMYNNEKMRGGAVLVNTDSYKRAGMENEGFYGWGSEDFERYDRWTILGYKIFRSQGCLYHLTHDRGKNSRFAANKQFSKSDSLLFRTRVSTNNEIINKHK